ncbi:MAG TPA: 30S ribosome-binding factor RbfA [Firmicutes bacterium]|nr:30S ribosome-binding factor RbfA [Bacillota bacterium]
MARLRADRLAQLIRDEVSDILQRGLKDPRLGFVSVTDVEVSGDLSHAKVFVSLMGTEEEEAASLQALESATGFIRTELARRIRLRRVPEIVFKPDRSIARGARIFQLLSEIAKEKREGEP